MSRSERTGLAFLFVLAVASRSVRAESTTLQLSPPMCSVQPVDWDAFVPALRVELGESEMVLDTRRTSGSRFSLAMEATPCAPLANAVEIVVSNGSAEPLTRIVSLSDVPVSMRPRTVALASAELVALSRRTSVAVGTPAAADSSAIEAAPAPTAIPAKIPAVAVVEPAMTSPLMPSSESPPRRQVPGNVHPLLGMAGESRRYLDAATTLFGARAVSEWELPLKGVVMRIDATGLFGTSTSSLGDVSLQAFAVALGGEWVRSGDDVGFALGALGEGGYAHAKGHANAAVTATSADAASFAVMAVASMRVRVVQRLWAALELSAGVELAGLRAHADDSVAGGVYGPLLGVRLVAAYAR